MGIAFQFCFRVAIRRVQVKQDGLKLNGTYQVLIYADDSNITGGSVHTINKNAGSLLVAGTETGLKVNVDKSKYMDMSADQNAGRSHRIKTDNESLQRLGKLKYLGMNLTNLNNIQEEIKCRMKSGDVCYHTVRVFCPPVWYLQFI
jgi:hypothetical protein